MTTCGFWALFALSRYTSGTPCTSRLRMGNSLRTASTSMGTFTPARSRTCRLVHAEAGIALALELVGELRSPGLHDAAVEEDVDVVRCDVSEDSRVVRDQQGPDTGLPDLVHASAHDPQRVDVETGVGLVQDGDLGLEQRHLQDLVAFLLPAGEAL